MKVVLQRTKQAKCSVNNQITGKIDKGYLLLVGFSHADTIDNINKMAKKIANLRIFEDANEKMNLNIFDAKGSILSISQFTLYANTTNGNRPSFTDSMNPHQAKLLYLEFNQALRNYNLHVEEGIFGEHMEVEFINDGPVTLILEY